MYAIRYKELVKKDEGINNNMAKKRDKKNKLRGKWLRGIIIHFRYDTVESAYVDFIRKNVVYLQEMFDAARKDGIYPVVWEGYRTHEELQKILDDKIKAYINEGYSQSRAERTAKEWVALPGTSEHQLGITVDINADKSKSSNDKVYTWLAANAHNYGFILRYPQGKQEITGTSYEPWHYRYVGVDAAREIYERGICLEEYFEQ